MDVALVSITVAVTSTQGSIQVDNKAEFKIRTQKIGSYEVIYSSGGPVPAALRGAWNRKKLAQVAIDRYVAELALITRAQEDKREAKVAAEQEVAKNNRDKIKAKSEAKKAAKVEKVNGEGQARV
jgi:hypothetical protein